MLRKLTRSFVGFSRGEDGGIAALAAVLITVIVGFGAFAIDMSYAYSTRNLLQVTASAAALAAAPELPDQNDARAKAKEYAEENMAPENHGSVVVDDDVVFGNWDDDTKIWTAGGSPLNAVQVTARRSEDNDNRLDLFLAPILGLGFLDMEASAVAYAKPATAWDVMIVQDATGTFLEEMGDARDANQTMLNCVSNAFVEASMGLTVFNGTAQVRQEMKKVGLPDHEANYNEMSAAIDQLNACNGPPSTPPMPECTGTHVGIGIERAIQRLDAYPVSPGILGQAIVIVGDGRPKARTNAQSLYDESEYYSVCGGNCSNSELAEMANLAADDAESKDYDVYTIFYDEDNDDTAAAFFEGLVRGNGQFRRTPDSDQLDEMMVELCNTFKDLQLVM